MQDSSTPMLSPWDAEEALCLQENAQLRVLFGPLGSQKLLPMQRRLVRRLGFEVGGLNKAVPLACLNVAKAEVSECPADYMDALLDLAELLNLRAYMRTFVSRRGCDALELEDAVIAAERAELVSRAWRGESDQRIRLLRGRTLTSAAHALALNAIGDEKVRARLLDRWGKPKKMFDIAVRQYEEALALSTTSALERASLLASFGECWFCIASVEETEGGDGVQLFAERSRLNLDRSIAIFTEANLRDTVAYADALKDQGKVLWGFFGDNDGKTILSSSVRLHTQLLGPDHPRTLNAVRLLLL